MTRTLADYVKHDDGCESQTCDSCGVSIGQHPFSGCRKWQSMTCSCGLAALLRERDAQPKELGPCQTGSACLYSCVDECFREKRDRERDAQPETKEKDHARLAPASAIAPESPTNAAATEVDRDN